VGKLEFTQTKKPVERGLIYEGLINRLFTFFVFINSLSVVYNLSTFTIEEKYTTFHRKCKYNYSECHHRLNMKNSVNGILKS